MLIHYNGGSLKVSTCAAIAKPLTDLMNRSLAEGSIPMDWKHAIVTPVFKSGTKTDLSNYRPISVLPVFCKIFERATSVKLPQDSPQDSFFLKLTNAKLPQDSASFVHPQITRTRA